MTATSTEAGGTEAMSRGEWLGLVVRQANLLYGTHAGALASDDDSEAEGAASEMAAAVVAGSAQPLDLVRHSALREPRASLWRESRSWPDAVVAVACACLEHDILEHARRIATGEVPAIDPAKMA
jgi:hypothetical protein